MPNYEDSVIDKEYEFFVKYLKDLAEIESEDNILDVTDILGDDFLGYDVSIKRTEKMPSNGSVLNKNLINSYAYYVSTGLITQKNNRVYINLAKLKEENKKYEAQNEKGISFKKGGLK